MIANVNSPFSNEKFRGPVWTIQDLSIAVTRRKMKHLRITVNPPDGEVKVSAPRYVSNAEIQEFIYERLDWVQEQRAWFRAQPRKPVPQLQSGESLRLWGETCELKCVPQEEVHRYPFLRGRFRVFKHGDIVYLKVANDEVFASKQKILDNWHRQLLKEKIPELIQIWSAPLDVNVQDWGIKKMKTRWGSCSIQAARIWLNLELIHYPPRCLQYVVVHELAHLIEANHSPRFWAILDRHLPDWRSASDLLKNGMSAL